MEAYRTDKTLQGSKVTSLVCHLLSSAVSSTLASKISKRAWLVIVVDVLPDRYILALRVRRCRLAAFEAGPG